MYLYMLFLEFLQISKAGKIKQVPLLPVPRPLSCYGRTPAGSGQHLGMQCSVQGELCKHPALILKEETLSFLTIWNQDFVEVLLVFLYLKQHTDTI